MEYLSHKTSQDGNCSYSTPSHCGTKQLGTGALQTHLSASTPDCNTLLTEQQKLSLSRSCPQCKCGTLYVVARSS
jgi:hypothetical protein